MTMLSRALAKGLAILGVLAGMGTFASAAHAQAASCGVTGSSTASPATYDPFDPQGLPNTTITMTLRRVNTSGGGFTKDVNFYLRSATPGTNGTSIVPVTITNANNWFGGGLNIFIDSNLPNPTVSPAATTTPSAGNRFLRIIFDGNNAAADTVTATFNVTLPPNLNFQSTQNLSFTAYFGCDIQGGSANGVEQTGQITNAIVFPITVPSSLRASFAGDFFTGATTGTMAFGNVGEVSLADAPSKKTSANNHVRVQSNSPYTVKLHSDRGYKMTVDGLPTADAAQKLNYNLKFLNQIRNASDTSDIEVNCLLPGIGSAFEDKLYMQAQLAEAGTDNAPSTTYSDTLTVTITPKVIGSANTGDTCKNLSGTF